MTNLEILDHPLITGIEYNDIVYYRDTGLTVVKYYIVGEGLRIEKTLTLTQEQSSQWGDDDTFIDNLVIQDSKL